MPFVNLVISTSPDPVLARSLARGVSERTARILHKRADATAVAVSCVPPDAWFVAGRSLEEQGVASFSFEVTVTQGTNTKDEKSAYLAEIFAFLQEQLGVLHETSYAVVREAPADSWGYGGVSQEERYVRGKLRADDARATTLPQCALAAR
jgi:4-oxalocrotonate tautomerase